MALETDGRLADEECRQGNYERENSCDGKDSPSPTGLYERATEVSAGNASNCRRAPAEGL